MTRLSVNINKIATIRNARGGNVPNVMQAAINVQEFGAQGVTVHPRPDERHIRYQDVWDIKPHITTEFNIEGFPNKKFMELVLAVKPHQVTLVPDPPDVLTSNAGWDTIKNKSFLQDIIGQINQAGIRSSIFIGVDDLKMLAPAKETGTNRIELYTEPYAARFHENKQAAVAPFTQMAIEAHRLGLEINAGHDLDLENLKFFLQHVPHVAEVSIGHALIADALYYGLHNTIQMYLRQLEI